jgi:hypothetical protein
MAVPDSQLSAETTVVAVQPTHRPPSFFLALDNSINLPVSNVPTPIEN